MFMEGFLVNQQVLEMKVEVLNCSYSLLYHFEVYVTQEIVQFLGLRQLLRCDGDFMEAICLLQHKGVPTNMADVFIVLQCRDRRDVTKRTFEFRQFIDDLLCEAFETNTINMPELTTLGTINLPFAGVIWLVAWTAIAVPMVI